MSVLDDMIEVIKERAFKPMYFYFIIAWTITNWNFLYVFLFENEEFILKNKSILKSEYLESIYQWDFGFEGLYSISFLFIIPAFSTYFVVWWLSKLSVKFFMKNEEHLERINSVKKLVLEKEKYYFENEMIRIRKEDELKNQIRYDANPDFNEDFDSTNEDINILGVNILASQALYDNDYKVYESALKDFKERPKDDE